MNKSFMKVGTTSCVVISVALASAQYTGESRLLGIGLYSTGLDVITKFGSPLEIQALTLGGSGAPGAQGTAGSNSGTQGSSNRTQLEGAVEINVPIIGDPFGDGHEWRQMSGANEDERTPGTTNNSSNTSREQGNSGTANTSGGNSGSIVITRWVYKRGASKYAFVFDKYNRVIQIEAIGMNDSRVRTRRGIGFGSSFSNIMRAHTAPDSYDVSGDTIVVRCLVKDRVAFRLQRLEANKPPVVTGVVVAAGKA